MWWAVDAATIMPIRNAPMATDRPILDAASASVNRAPMQSRDICSSLALLWNQSMILGTSFRPMVKQTIMKMAIWMISRIRSLVPSSAPLSMGVSMDSMMTCPMSSMIITRTRISTWALSSMSFSFRTAITTAVLDPEMIAPRAMLWTML